MTREELIDLVRNYFASVDAEDMPRVLSTLTEDCRFSVETHNVVLTGHQEIQGMLKRLWLRHAAVQHDRFRFVVELEAGKIAARFRVVNTFHNGETVTKANCNFFTVRDGRFDTVVVYMAGENTLVRGEG